MNFEKYIKSIKAWGIDEEAVNAIVLVGSYARGTNNPSSDIDLVILTTEKLHFVSSPSLFSKFGEITKYNIEYYGAVTSVRAWYLNGFEVEYGIAEPSWISLPLDNGTKTVLSDGYKVIIDKCDYFKNLSLQTN